MLNRVLGKDFTKKQIPAGSAGMALADIWREGQGQQEGCKGTDPEWESCLAYDRKNRKSKG